MKIEIPGTPIALKRPRFGDGKVFDSQTRDKSVVRLLMRSNHVPCVDLYCNVSLTFVFSSHDSLELWGAKLPTKQDLDNLIKWTLDCGNGILWSDDRLIVAINAEKRYDKKAYTLIEITPLETMTKEQLKVLKAFTPSEVSEMRMDFLNHLDFIDKKAGEIPNALIYLGKKWGPRLKKVGE